MEIPSQVTIIEQWAFNNSGLTQVTVPEGVTVLDNCFANCKSLTKVTLPSTVTTLRDTFRWSEELSDVNIPGSVRSITVRAFEDTAITSIEIPEGAVLGEAVFKNCEQLQAVTLPQSLKRLEREVFRGCSALDSVAMPTTLNFIGVNAFYECTSLSTITIPSTVKTIGSDAFYGCTSLTSATLQPGAIVDCNVFVGCTSLATLNVDPSDPNHQFSGGALYNKDMSKLIAVVGNPADFEVPAGVMEVGRRAFGSLTGLYTVSVPHGVTAIGANCFEGCTSLLSAHLPSTITEMGAKAFNGCGALSNITIPSGLKAIREDTFRGCGFFNVIVPEGVETIGARAFFHCVKLESVELPSTLLSIGESAFEGTKVTSVKMPSGLKKIERKAFPTTLKNVVIPSTVESLGAFALPSLTHIAVPSSIAEVSSDVFKTESGTSRTPPKNVTIYRTGAGTVPYSNLMSFFTAQGTAVTLADDQPLNLADVAKSNVTVIALSPETVNTTGLNMYDGTSPPLIGADRAGKVYDKKSYGWEARSDKHVVTWDVWGTKVPEVYGKNALPAFKGNPAMVRDIQYVYTFQNWEPAEPFPAVTGNATYKANYSKTIREYIVNWYWNTPDGQSNHETVWTYGAMPSHLEPDPYETDTQVFDFTGWDPTVSSVVGHQVYRAQYSASPRPYTITFNPSGAEGTYPDEIAQGYDTVVELPGEVPGLTKTGYYFAGWTRVPGNTTPVAIPYKVPVGGETLFAIWLSNAHDVYFYVGGTEYGYQSVLDGDKAVRPQADPSRAGHTFDGWYLMEASYDFTAQVHFDLALYAKFTPIPYTITYNLYGGTNNAFNPPSYTILSETITFADPVKPGYAFGGWFADAGFQNEAPSIPAGSTGDRTLHAKFTPIPYTITYVLKPGDAIDPDNPLTYDVETPDIILKDATRAHYTFAGWYSDTGLTLKVETIPKESTGAVVLYPKFVPFDYTISYEENGGTKDPLSRTWYNIESWVVNLFPATKDHYVFKGWFDNAGFEGEAVTEIPTGSHGDRTYYAKFTPREYAISYETYGGDKGANPITYNIETPEITLADAERDYYTFVGWYSDSGFGTKYEKIPQGSTGDVRLYAKYTPIEYEIKYHLYDGDNDPSNYPAYTTEHKTFVLASAYKTGHVFDGWYREAEYINKVTHVYNGSHGVLDLHAKYTVKDRTVTYYVDGAQYGEVETYGYGAPLPAIRDAPPRDGHTFSGWTPSELPPTMSEVNIIVTGYFTPRQHAISFTTSGGTVIPPIVQAYGTPVAKPVDPERTGYVFEEWEPALPETMPDEDLTLVAKWTPTVYAISFLPGGGTGTMDGMEVRYGDEVQLPANAFTKQNLFFAGWRCGCHGKLYSDRQVVSNLNADSGTVELTAVWASQRYSITYVTHGGSDGGNPAVYFADTLPISLKPASKPGVAFAGWYDNGSFSGERWDSIPVNTVGDLTLHAKFILGQYAVTYHLGGGTNDPDNPSSYTTESPTVALKPASREGYVFNGWFLEPGFANQAFQIPAGPMGDLELYAKFTPKVYNIGYSLNGGTNSVENPTTYTVVSPTIPLANAFKAGHVFGGWFSDPGFSEQVMYIPVGSTGDRTLHAKFTPKQYTITYYVDGVREDPVEEYAYGAPIAIREYPVKEGHTFSGWNPPLFTPTMPDADIFVSGTFTPNQHIITFSTSGGTFIPPVTQAYGKPVAVPADPERTGYVFNGWQPELPATMPDEDLTLVAQWTPTVYTIRFFSNGGTGSMGDQTATYDEEVELSPNGFTKQGLLFAGWRCGCGKMYYDRQVVSNLAADSGTISLTAIWVAEKYDIEYFVHGGVPGNNPVAYFEDALPLRLEPATKHGEVFAGWYPDESYSGEPWASIPVGTTGDLTLHAKFVVGQYTVTYIVDGVPHFTDTFAYGEEAAMRDAPDKNGYGFDGWFSDPGFTFPVIGIPAGQEDDMVLYSKYTPIVYGITYNLDGGANAPVNPEAYTVVSPTISLAPATKTGHTFGGWFSDPGFESPVTEIASESTGAVELYAKFSLNLWTITYHVDGAQHGEAETHGYGSPIAIREDPPKVGHTFSGWNPSTLFATMPDGDILVTGTFTANKYALTFSTSGGTVIQPIVQAYGTPVEKPADPERTGYAFAGWDKPIPLTVPAEDFHANAIWTPTEYTIKFQSGGGAGTMADQAAVYGQDAELSANAFTNAGMFFAGWKDASGRMYADRQTVRDLSADSGTVILTATWAAEKYAITYETYGGAPGDNPASYFEGSLPLRLEPASKPEAAFVGWYPNPSFSGDPWASIPAGTTGDLTLHAKYIVGQYGITYHLNGGTNSEANPATYTAGSGTITLEPASREGHAFAGWFSDAGFSNRVTQIPAGSTGDVELHAKFTPLEYRITYNLYGGTNAAANPVTYTVLSHTIVLAPASKVGHAFEGWYSDEGFGNEMAQIPAGSTGDVDVHAKFALNSWNLTYRVDGKQHGEVETHPYGSPIAIRENPSEEGYSFSGWNPGTLPGTMPDTNIVVTGTFTPNQYVLTFSTSGGTVIQPIVQAYGTPVEKPSDPERAGYVFDGWDKEIPETVPAWNFHADAVWTPTEYAIAFLPGGGTGSMPDQILEYGREAELSANAFTNAGMLFAGWKDASGRMYADRQTVSDLRADPGTFTLTATWAAERYSITYVTYGGTPGDNPDSYFGGALPQRLGPASKPGAAFAGWYPDESFSGDPWSGIPVGTTGDLTLHAKYIVGRYTVTYVVDGSQYAVDTFACGDPVTMRDAPSKEGFAFFGWNPSSLPGTMPAEHITVFGSFSEILRTLAFDSAGGSAVQSMTQRVGTPIVAPKDPVREAHAFAGWAPALPKVMPDEDATLVAQWTPLTYKIVFKPNGGAGNMEPMVVNSGDEFHLTPNSFTKEGLEFHGWKSSATGEIYKDGQTLIAPADSGEIVLTAQWSQAGGGVDGTIYIIWAIVTILATSLLTMWGRGGP